MPLRKNKQGLFKKNIIALRGGRKARFVKSMERKVYLGGNYEGHVYETEITAERGGKKRRITLAEKEMHSPPPGESPIDINYRNPARQFKVMTELANLNRKKKLGLRIVQTIRLIEPEGGKSRLFTTKLDILKQADFGNLPKEEIYLFYEDEARQIAIGKKNGYHIEPDAFFPVRDKQTGKIVPVIGDFGLVRKLGEESR